MASRRHTPFFKDSRRLEAFSDGVFAILITLLVLDIKVPSAADASSPGLLWSALLRRWPSYFAFVLAFGTILVAWIGHHLLLQDVRVVTLRLVRLNGLFLLTVTFLPFPTSLVAAYLTEPAAPVAAAVYAGISALISLTFLLLRLAVQDAGETKNATSMLIGSKSQLGTVFFAAATALAFVSPIGSLLVVAAVWVWWALPT